MQKPPVNAKKAKRYHPPDHPTDQRTNGHGGHAKRKTHRIGASVISRRLRNGRGFGSMRAFARRRLKSVDRQPLQSLVRHLRLLLECFLKISVYTIYSVDYAWLSICYSQSLER